MTASVGGRTVTQQEMLRSQALRGTDSGETAPSDSSVFQEHLKSPDFMTCNVCCFSPSDAPRFRSPLSTPGNRGFVLLPERGAKVNTSRIRAETLVAHVGAGVGEDTK